MCEMRRNEQAYLRIEQPGHLLHPNLKDQHCATRASGPAHSRILSLISIAHEPPAIVRVVVRTKRTSRVQPLATHPTNYVVSIALGPILPFLVVVIVRRASIVSTMGRRRLPLDVLLPFFASDSKPRPNPDGYQGAKQ